MVNPGVAKANDVVYLVLAHECGQKIIKVVYGAGIRYGVGITLVLRVKMAVTTIEVDFKNLLLMFLLQKLPVLVTLLCLSIRLVGNCLVPLTMFFAE